MDGIVVRRLREAQKWLVLQQFVDYAIWGLLAGLAVFAISRMAAASIPKAEVPWLVAVASSLALAALGAIYRWRSLRAVARELDARAKTKDRFLTALALPRNETGALLDAVRHETSTFASTLSPREHLPLKVSAKKALWLLVPAVALGLWEGFQVWQTDLLAPELAIAQKLVEQVRRAAELEAKKDEALQLIAQQLQTSEDQLTASREPLREALRTLSDLEQKLSSQSSLDSAEANTLADALSRNHAELASNLRAGRNAEATRALAQLDPAELASALKEAARHLEAKRLRELATQSATAAKLQLAIMLGSSPGSGRETARRFVAALRDTRSGAGAVDRDRAQQIEGAEVSPGNGKSPSYAADNAPPSGLPGTEKDFGRGEDLSREAEPPNSPPGSEDFVEGEIGEGASLIELFRAAGNDDPKARRAYRSAYQTAAPAALDAVSREQIPAGSRLLVRRYFEAIRPKE
jgi:hypothetical protein